MSSNIIPSHLTCVTGCTLFLYPKLMVVVGRLVRGEKMTQFDFPTSNIKKNEKRKTNEIQNNCKKK